MEFTWKWKNEEAVSFNPWNLFFEFIKASCFGWHYLAWLIVVTLAQAGVSHIEVLLDYCLGFGSFSWGLVVFNCCNISFLNNLSLIVLRDVNALNGLIALGNLQFLFPDWLLVMFLRSVGVLRSRVKYSSFFITKIRVEPPSWLNNTHSIVIEPGLAGQRQRIFNEANQSQHVVETWAALSEKSKLSTFVGISLVIVSVVAVVPSLEKRCNVWVELLNDSIPRLKSKHRNWNDGWFWLTKPNRWLYWGVFLVACIVIGGYWMLELAQKYIKVWSTCHLIPSSRIKVKDNIERLPLSENNLEHLSFTVTLDQLHWLLPKPQCEIVKLAKE